MNYIFLLIIFGGLVFLFIKDAIYNSTSHCLIEDASKLRTGAQIIDVKSESVGHKQTSALRTTVLFDDGFAYISHKSERRQFLATIQMRVTEDIMNEILFDAVKAHEDAVAKNIA